MQLYLNAQLAVLDTGNGRELVLWHLTGGLYAKEPGPGDRYKIRSVGKSDGRQLLQHRLLGDFQLSPQLVPACLNGRRNVSFIE